MVDIAELHHDPVADLVNRMQAKTMHPLQDCVPAPQGGERPTRLQYHGGQGQVPRHEQVRKRNFQHYKNRYCISVHTVCGRYVGYPRRLGSVS
jgi:hypothetical protein